MRLAPLWTVTDRRGQSAPGAAASLIISVVVVIIVVSQLFGAGIGPENENAPGYETYQTTQKIAWAGLTLLAVAIIVMAASVILGMFRGGGGI